MTYTYYPGCSLHSTSRAYDESLRSVFRILGLELREIPDWNCCGATMYMAIDGPLATTISARNLAIAETMGHDVVTPCSSCFTILSKTHRLMRDNPEIRARISEALSSVGLRYDLSLRIRHPLDVLVNDVGVELIRLKAVRQLHGLRIANYYGCQIVRPERGFDDRENPTTMDSLFEALGGTNVPFPMKVRCCGGMLMTTRTDTALKLVHELLACAEEHDADCIVTTCPLCQINLEAYQRRINVRWKTRHRMPILFFTQLLGFTLGADDAALGLPRQLVPFDIHRYRMSEV